MELKKNTKKELGWKRLDFFLIGLICSIGLSLLAFSWKSYETTILSPSIIIWEEEEKPIIVEIEETQKVNKAKPRTEELIEDFTEIETIIENTEEIEEKFEIDFNFEFDDYQMYGASDEIIDTDEIIEMIDVSELAEFIHGGEMGLLQFLSQNTTYPTAAREIGIQGIVYVIFVINTDGSIGEITFGGKKLGFGLEEEAKRVIKLTSGMWKPAKQRDKEVAMRYRLPYHFQLK